MDDIGIVLGSAKDMAHHNFTAYQVEDEMYIVYDNGHSTSKKIQEIKENIDEYLYTPYVLFIHKCGYNNAQ